MLLDVLIAAEDLGRLQEITKILIQSGFEDIAQRMGLLGLLQRTGRLLRIDRADRITEGGTPQRTRLALEALGPTFVKLGQVLASRADLLPPEWVEELSLLQSNVGTIPWEELRPQLERDLGAPPESVFEDLDIEPLAAGSIGQVHRASLQDGQEVVLKIRRPGITKKVSADLRLLERLAEIIERELTEFRRYRPKMVVRQFARSIKAELDFTIEARNTRTIARNMKDLDDLEIPEVFDEFSSKRLLVLSYVDGFSAGTIGSGTQPESTMTSFDSPRGESAAVTEPATLKPWTSLPPRRAVNESKEPTMNSLSHSNFPPIRPELVSEPAGFWISSISVRVRSQD